jgi:hypothetical protein
VPLRGFDDPDARLRRWGWLAFAAWTIIGGVPLWHALRAGEDALVGVALVAPLWAAWLLWLLWRAAVALRLAARQRALGRWHGSYFEFDGRQIRILFDDEQILVAAADVFDALGIEARGREPERVRLLAGRDGLIELRGEAPLYFTARGLQAWMERRSGEQALRWRRWFESEVVAPRRRRHDRPPRASGDIS